MSLLVNLLFKRAALLAVGILFVFPAGIATAQEIDGDQLLDPNRLIEVRIKMAPDDWAQLCRQSPNPATAFSGLPSEKPYTYFKADLWIDDVKIESVGVRKKGFFGSSDFQRPSLKVKFDEYVKGQDPVKGLNRLTLNNNKQDRAQVSQFLVYQLFRDAGNPAPRSNWAHVTVNGDSLGVYSNVESIKKPFLKRNFEDGTGNLYEATLTDFHPKAIDNIEVKTNKAKNAREDIKRFANLMAKEGELDVDEMGRIIDLDSFFRHWALEGLTGFWDGYGSNTNNFYLYFNPKNEGRGTFIPWGADFALTNQGPFSRGNRGTTVVYAQGILTHRLYHTKGGPERYRATMKRMLDEVWNEKKMLAEIDRIEKLVSPHLHQAQSTTPEMLNQVREYIRGRRAAVELALKEWQPTIPAEPRTPAHIVDVGKASGSFSAAFSEGQPDESAAGKTDLTLELDGKPLQFEQISVRAQLSPFGGFGRRGGRPGGFGGGRPGGGFGGGRGAPTTGSTPAAPPAPVSLVFTGTRADGQPVTVSLTIDRKKFDKPSDEAISVTGSFREGRGGGGGFGGFGGGFGGGPRRSVLGTLRLTKKSGVKPGDELVGSVDLRIVESRGGFMQRRPQGGGGRPGNTSRTPGSPQPLTLQSALDTDRDGEISAKEMEAAVSALKRLDRDQDGKLSRDELQSWPQRSAPGRRNTPARPELDDDDAASKPTAPKSSDASKATPY